MRGAAGRAWSWNGTTARLRVPFRNAACGARQMAKSSPTDPWARLPAGNVASFARGGNLAVESAESSLVRRISPRIGGLNAHGWESGQISCSRLGSAAVDEWLDLADEALDRLRVVRRRM